MVEDEYLNLEGLTYYHSKVKDTIPTKTSELENDSNFIANVSENMLVGSDYITPYDGTGAHEKNDGWWNATSGGNGVISVVDVDNAPNSSIKKKVVIADNTSGNRDLTYCLPAPLKAGTYTMSAYVKTESGRNAPILWRIWQNSPNQEVVQYRDTKALSEWTRVSYTFTIENDIASTVGVKFGMSGVAGATDVEYCGFMLNKGDTALDYTAIEYATDNIAGIVKTNSANAITINGVGQLEVGGRLGQIPNGGVYYPTTIAPTGVGQSSFLMTDGAKGLKVSGRTFAILAGANLTCRSAAAGSTEYRLVNNQANRFVCFAGKGGRLALSGSDASTNGTALITSIKFANGNDISAYFGPVENNNDIIITVDKTVNPSAATTVLRIYGTSTSNDVIIVGQGVGASNGKAISLGQSCYAGGNQTIAFGNSSMALANNSVALGHTQLVNKQFCFAAGQGHDFTNGSNGASAVGIASSISSDTAFAVGNGKFDGNGNTTRSNALEVLKDGSVVLPSPNGTRWKIKVDDSGNLTTEAIA